MYAMQVLEFSHFLTVAFAIAVIAAMTRKRVLTAFKPLFLFLLTELLEEIVVIPLMFFRKHTGIPLLLAYNIYFYAECVGFLIKSALMIAVIYRVFHAAMKPLVGLHRVGGMFFRWVACVAMAFSLCVALGPVIFGELHGSSILSAQVIVVQIQEGLSVLILCLLLFVCFAIKPLGLTYRSHIFGISLGLGMIATVQLAVSVFFAPAQSIYAPLYSVVALGCCMAHVVWGSYFALPEPKRRMILLPTTSPYFWWNAISEALGDEPGDVAIAGFTPDMLAPAEMEMIARQTSMARKRLENTVLGGADLPAVGQFAETVSA